MRPALAAKAMFVVYATVSLANAQSAAAAELKAGIEAKAAWRYTVAIEHFQKAVALDPAMIAAHLQLAETEAVDCFASPLTSDPGPDLCTLATQEYRKVLKEEPSNAEASKGLAFSLYYQYRVDESEAQFRAALSALPGDSEIMCGLTKIDSEKAYRAEALGKVNAGLSIKDSLVRTPACADARSHNLFRIDEGIAFATSLTRRYPADANFAGFLGLLYKERADIECGDGHAFKIDKKASAEWYRAGKRTLRTTAKGPQNDAPQRCPPAPPPLQ